MKRDDILKALECCKDRRCDLCDRRYGYHAEESICRLDLIEQAHHLIGCQMKEIDRLNGDVSILERCLKEAKERADALSPQWIPVTERLPENDEAVLGYLPGRKATQSKIQTLMGWMVPIHATHWMPLPEPPKEDEDGQNIH